MMKNKYWRFCDDLENCFNHSLDSVDAILAMIEWDKDIKKLPFKNFKDDFLDNPSKDLERRDKEMARWLHAQVQEYIEGNGKHRENHQVKIMPKIFKRNGDIIKIPGKINIEKLDDRDGVYIKDIDDKWSASEGMFYHGSNESFSTIKKEGLTPKKNYFQGTIRIGVFLSTDTVIAQKYGKYVYEITLGPNAIIYRDETEDSSWFYKKPISPRKIKLINY